MKHLALVRIVLVSLSAAAALTFSSCVSKPLESSPCDSLGGGCRPFRTGIIKFDRVLDDQKPVGAIDESGWTLSGTVIVGSFDSNWLGAYDLKKKQHLWWFPLPTSITTPAEIFGGFVVISMRDGRLVKIDLQTGKQIWEQRLTQFVSSKIALSGNTLLAFSVDQKLYAVDFQTGQNLWVYDAGTAPNLLLRGGAGPQVVGSQIFLGTAEGDVRLIGLATGKENWRMGPSRDDFRFKDVMGEVGVGNNQIYVARYDGLVFAVDTAQKPSTTLWQESFASITAAAYRDGSIYIGCINGDFVAIQASNGRKLWSTNLGQSVKSITIGEKAIFAGGSQGRISAVSSANGQLLWHDDVQGILTKQPFVLEDEIYFATGLKVLYSYKIIY